MIRAAGASFKIRSIAGVMTEVAHWFTGITPGTDQDRDEAVFFNPSQSLPTKRTLFGAITREYTLTGKWNAAAEVFFNAIQGATDVPYEFAPEGLIAGKTIKSGSCNVGAWADPGGDASGSWDTTISLAVNVQHTTTIPASAPAADTITSSSVADPTLITTSAAHGFSAGSVITIAGHTGSTPTLDGVHTVTAVPSTTTFNIPVSVTVGGTGGTAQD